MLPSILLHLWRATVPGGITFPCVMFVMDLFSLKDEAFYQTIFVGEWWMGKARENNWADGLT